MWSTGTSAVIWQTLMLTAWFSIYWHPLPPSPDPGQLVSSNLPENGKKQHSTTIWGKSHVDPKQLVKTPKWHLKTCTLIYWTRSSMHSSPEGFEFESCSVNLPGFQGKRPTVSGKMWTVHLALCTVTVVFFFREVMWLMRKCCPNTKHDLTRTPANLLWWKTSKYGCCQQHLQTQRWSSLYKCCFSLCWLNLEVEERWTCKKGVISVFVWGGGCDQWVLHKTTHFIQPSGKSLIH